MREKIVVTGGSGFIGAWVIRKLLALGEYDVITLDSNTQYFSPFADHAPLYFRYLDDRFRGIRNGVTFYRIDTRDADGIRRLFDEHRPSRIIHLAALPIAKVGMMFTQEAFGSITQGAVNILETIRGLDYVKRFLYISSSMVYGDFQYRPADEEHPTKPKEIYGGAKLCGEILTKTFSRLYGIEYAIVRPSAVYGPGDVNRRVSQIFVENALLGKPLRVMGADNAYDFTYVEDIAEGIIKVALAPEAANETFNITRGEGRTLKEYAEIVKRFVPEAEIQIEEADKTLPKRGALGIEKAGKLVNYKPRYGLEEGVEKYIKYLRELGVGK